jgi:hypothetical protein
MSFSGFFSARKLKNQKIFRSKVEKRKKSWRESWKFQNFSGRNLKNQKKFRQNPKNPKKKYADPAGAGRDPGPGAADRPQSGCRSLLARGQARGIANPPCCCPGLVFLL